nr:hypothetical protein [uncultured bacterium]
MPPLTTVLAGALLLQNDDIKGTALAGSGAFKLTMPKAAALAGALYLVAARNLTDTICGSVLTSNTSPKAAILAGSVKFLDGAFIYLNAGDFAVSWRSRNRFETGFNLMTNTTVTEDADFKQFRIEVYDVADNLLRTVEQAGKSWTYTAAEQATDGGPFTYYRVRIYQEAELYQGLPYEFHIFII